MTAPTVARPARALAANAKLKTHTPPLDVADGTLEALKWIALVLMILDHTNKFLYRGQLPVLFELGRLVLPIFGFVLAYNLTRPGALARGVHLRMMTRLAVVGALATPLFNTMVGWWVLNILFLLLLTVAIVFFVERGGNANKTIAAVLFVLGGACVEFWWLGLACCLTAWMYCRQPSVKRLLWWSLATGALVFINQNLWSLVAIPLLWVASHIDVTVPRARWAFYALYPLHLLALLVVQQVWFSA